MFVCVKPWTKTYATVCVCMTAAVAVAFLCRFLDSIPKVQSAVTILEEADERYIKKQRGIIADNAMLLDRAATKLASIRSHNISMGKPADVTTDKIAAAEEAVGLATALHKRLDEMDPPGVGDVTKFVQQVSKYVPLTSVLFP